MLNGSWLILFVTHRFVGSLPVAIDLLGLTGDRAASIDHQARFDGANVGRAVAETDAVVPFDMTVVGNDAGYVNIVNVQHGSSVVVDGMQQGAQLVHGEQVGETHEELVRVLSVDTGRHVPLVIQLSVRGSDPEHARQARWNLFALDVMGQQGHVHNHIVVRLEHVLALVTVSVTPLQQGDGLQRNVEVILLEIELENIVELFRFRFDLLLNRCTFGHANHKQYSHFVSGRFPGPRSSDDLPTIIILARCLCCGVDENGRLTGRAVACIDHNLIGQEHFLLGMLIVAFGLDHWNGTTTAAEHANHQTRERRQLHGFTCPDDSSTNQ